MLVEAGHRCTIPTCRQFPVQIHDIEEQAADEADDVIALCSDCHERVARGYITRRSLEQYKANLAIINARYGGLERRALYTFVGGPDARCAAADRDGNPDVVSPARPNG